MAREQDQSQSPITLPRLKPPEKGCHPVHCHSHRTRSCRSQPRRDADRAGWRGQANALSAVTVRHADIESAWVSLSPAAQILCPTAFSSQVLGRKKTLTEDWNSRNGSSQSRWAQHQRGISPSMTHTQIECHPCAGETCMSYNDGAAFATTPWKRLFGSTPDGCRGWLCLQAGRCEVLILLLEAFQRRIPSSAKSQRRREFVAEEKKSEIRWQAADYIARRPSHFGGLHSHWIAHHCRALVCSFYPARTNHVQL